MPSVCSRFSLIASALLLCLPPVGLAQVPNLVFSSTANNDLFQAIQNTTGQAYDRYTDPLAAVENAPAGAGVLILADGYPNATTTIQQQVLNVAAAKNLKLYIEYPDSVPGLSFGTTYRNSVDRAVTDSNTFFGANLQQWDLLDPHEAMFVSVNSAIPDSRQHLRLARVAGYDTAAYGYTSVTPKPMLFEHSASGVEMLLSTTKMSNFVTGRYMPNDKWRDVWSGVIGWLDGNVPDLELQWTPLASPSFQRDTPLSVRARSEAVARDIDWYAGAKLLIHPDWFDEYQSINLSLDWHQRGPNPSYPLGDGSLGILEGTVNPVFDDGQQAIRWSVRADVVGETAMSYAFHSRLFGAASTGQIARNLLQYLDDPNGPLGGGNKSQPGLSAYGHRGWNSTNPWTNAFYSDDEARSLLGQLGVAAALGTQEYNAQIVTKILAQFQLTGVNGFWTADRIDISTQGPDFWVNQHQSTAIRPHPHFESYKLAGFLWLYDQTGDADLLDRSKAALGHMMNAYNQGNLNRTNGLQQERARLLLPLAWLLRVEDTPQHRQWLDQVFHDIVGDMDASGALAEDLGTGGSFMFPPAGSNSSFGSNEEPVIFRNGDPAADLLYTSNFALKGLIEAAAATGDVDYLAAAQRLGDFMIRVQVTSPLDQLDGSWARGFDFDRWDYWGSDGDAGWGVLGDQPGWTSGEIISALALLELETSLWDLAADLDVTNVYGPIRAQMFAPLNPIAAFDLNGDGEFDLDDWIEVFQPNLSRDLSGLGLSTSEAAALGDFNGNFVVDLSDFRKFKAAYDAHHGQGAFARSVAGVPEPAVGGALALLMLPIALLRWRCGG